MRLSFSFPFLLLAVVCVVAFAAPAGGQSLYLEDGEHAVDASAGWSVGPISNGVETTAAVGLWGRLDAGLSVRRYTLTFDDGSESTFDEYAPFVRYFPVKQSAAGAPVSLALNGQVFVDDYDTDDEGGYVQLGTTVYRSVYLSDRLLLQPFGGFGFVAEAYTFGDAPTERARYLTRDVGLHLTTPPDRPWMLRLTLVEQSFRRETYRGAHVSVLHRL